MLSDATVDQLARVAELPLDAARRKEVAEAFEPLLAEANEVNRFMAPRRSVPPGVRFHHPDVVEAE